jgi:hypothetical protein
MTKLFSKDLKLKFIEPFKNETGYTFGEGNPFLIKLKNKKYYIYLKNLTPAYFKNLPDITRVQLPYNENFKKILEEKTLFFILGYDFEADVFVTWNPSRIKERLNTRNNVSLYSRKSLQEKVKKTEFKISELSNNEKIVLFKRSSLLNFFHEIDGLFGKPEKIKTTPKKKTTSEPIIEYVTDKLQEITDKKLLEHLTPLLKKNQVLKAVEIAANFYSNKYQKMEFKDWYKIVNDIHKSLLT